MQSRTGGRAATEGVIPGNFAISVGNPGTQLPNGWHWTLLTDVARLETGHTPSRRHPEYWGGSIPWIGIRDATANHGCTIFDTSQHTNDLGIKNSSARVLPTNTVCLSRTASVGYVVVMGKPMATSQDFVNWVCGPGIDHRYLKYVLLGERDSFLRFASGTTHQTIYFPEVKAFHVALPPIEVQRRIADVLCLLDDRVAVLRSTTEKLEAMGASLFRSWFVDFDPVVAKADGREPECMDEPTSSLFPSNLEQSQLGPIPSGWSVGKVSDLFLLQRGFDLPASERTEGRHIVFAAGGPHGTHVDPMVKAPGVVTGRSGVIGNVFFAHEDYWPLNTTLWVKEFRRASPAFAFHFLKTMDLQRLNAGSAVPTLNRNHVHDQATVVPPGTIVDAFTKVVLPMMERVKANDDQSRRLLAIRDTMLPRLLAGKLSLPESLEEAVEEIA